MSIGDIDEGERRRGEGIVSEARELLRRLAGHDERLLETVLAPARDSDGELASLARALDRRTRLLVCLGALLAVDAPTTALRCAVELASTSGIDEDAILGALIACASVVGAAELVASAPRLALALGFDLELDGWNGC